MFGPHLLQLVSGRRLAPTQLGQSGLDLTHGDAGRVFLGVGRFHLGARRLHVSLGSPTPRFGRAKLLLQLADLAGPIGENRLAFVADRFERSFAVRCQQQPVHRQHGPGRRVGGQIGGESTVSLPGSRVVGEHDDALQEPAQQQVDGSNARRKLAGEPEDGQVLQRGLPVGRQVGAAGPAWIGGTQGGQGALGAVGVLTGRAQRVASLVELRRRLALGRHRRGVPAARRFQSLG